MITACCASWWSFLCFSKCRVCLFRVLGSHFKRARWELKEQIVQRFGVFSSASKHPDPFGMPSHLRLITDTLRMKNRSTRVLAARVCLPKCPQERCGSLDQSWSISTPVLCVWLITGEIGLSNTWSIPASDLSLSPSPSDTQTRTPLTPPTSAPPQPASVT